VRTLVVAIDILLEIYIWLSLAVAVMWWLIDFKVISTRNPVVAGIQRILGTLTWPLLGPLRWAVPTVGGLDMTPVLLLVILLSLRYALVLYIAPEFF
jgi:YggT family protein